jgi:hypothetical protein
LKKPKKDFVHTSERYCKSLDKIMLDQWIECTKGNFKYIRLEVLDENEESTEEDAEHWFQVYDQYIKRFGLSKHYTKVLLCMKELALLELKFAKLMAEGRPDRFLETLIDVQKQKLNDLMSESTIGMSIEDTLPMLSKAQGYAIRPHETRFIEYQKILESHGRTSKKK